MKETAKNINGQTNDRRMKMLVTTNMSKKSRYLYEIMWGNPDFDFPVEKTKVSDNKFSDNSYTFIGTSTTDEDVCRDKIADLFGIVEKEVFKVKFHQACGGDGHEIERIGTLHSSALCALLFFYNVTDSNPLIMKVNGRDCRFTYSRFEFQNRVIKGRRPSNMDITLVGEYVDGSKPVILFLESKFSEYMERLSKELKISESYLKNQISNNIYKNELHNLGLSTFECDANKFKISSREICYLEGIKQMISHFIGVNNFINGEFVTEDKNVTDFRNNADVFLGAILFDKGIGEYEISKGVSCYGHYKAKYERLADILNSQNSPVHVVKELLSYTMFEDIDFIKEDRIIRFYFNLTNSQN